jgi:UDP-N-acetyl-D-galactosamine dehydrogenase
VGYSPERINPGDQERRLANTIKITSGSTPEVANMVDELYRTIVTAGTFRASSIRVAEAAKIVENIQRDINIALMNELAVLFHKLSIDTTEVLQAAGTKWNFIPLRPGLVGGHCISVDPYYLIHKAQEIGHYPEIMMAARRANDAIEYFVADQFIKLMIKKRIHVNESKVLLLGLTFKENCPDIRNTRVMGIKNLLETYGCHVDLYDPWVDQEECWHEYGVRPVIDVLEHFYDGIILTVAHQIFKEKGIRWVQSLAKNHHVLYDVKSIFSRDEVDGRL